MKRARGRFAAGPEAESRRSAPVAIGIAESFGPVTSIRPVYSTMKTSIMNDKGNENANDAFQTIPSAAAVEF